VLSGVVGPILKGEGKGVLELLVKSQDVSYDVAKTVAQALHRGFSTHEDQDTA
jgi:hypothetical protein